MRAAARAAPRCASGAPGSAGCRAPSPRGRPRLGPSQSRPATSSTSDTSAAASTGASSWRWWSPSAWASDTSTVSSGKGQRAESASPLAKAVGLSLRCLLLFSANNLNLEMRESNCCCIGNTGRPFSSATVCNIHYFVCGK